MHRLSVSAMDRLCKTSTGRRGGASLPFSTGITVVDTAHGAIGQESFGVGVNKLSIITSSSATQVVVPQFGAGLTIDTRAGTDNTVSLGSYGANFAGDNVVIEEEIKGDTQGNKRGHSSLNGIERK